MVATYHPLVPRATADHGWDLELERARADRVRGSCSQVCRAGIVAARSEHRTNPLDHLEKVRACTTRLSCTHPRSHHIPVSVRCRLPRSHANASEGAWLLRRGCAPIVTLLRGGDGATSMAAPEVRGAHRTSNAGPICPILCTADCLWSLGSRSQTLARALWRPPKPPACAPARVASVPPPPPPRPLVCAPVSVAEVVVGTARVLDLGPGMMSLCVCMSAELRDPG